MMFEKIREYAKWPLQNIPRRACKMKPPIVVVSTRRSGSTLLLEALYSSDRTDYVDQPLDVWRGNIYDKYLPSHEKNVYPYTEEAYQIIGSLLIKLGEYKVRLRNQWNPLDSDFSPVVERVIIKLLNGKNIYTETELTKRFKNICLFRHPFCVASSVIELGWGVYPEAYISCEGFCDRYMTQEQQNFCNSVLSSGSVFDRSVLEWSLENLPILRNMQNYNCIVLTYEELVLKSSQIARMLASRLNLDSSDDMLDRLRSPSKNTYGSSYAEFNRSGAESLVTRRFDELSNKKRISAGRILDTLDISLYDKKSPFPTNDYTHYGDLDTSI